jgi:hypothetical protein
MSVSDDPLMVFHKYQAFILPFNNAKKIRALNFSISISKGHIAEAPSLNSNPPCYSLELIQTPYDTETIAQGRRGSRRRAACKRHVEARGAGGVRGKLISATTPKKSEALWECAVVCASFAAFGVGAKPHVSLLSELDVGYISVLFSGSSFEPPFPSRLRQLPRHRACGPLVT